MKPAVLDASAAAPWFLPDEASSVADSVYAELRSGASLFCAPALWLWETGNLLLVARRRGRIDDASLEFAINQLASAPLQIDTVPDAHRRAQTLRLASVHALSYYDASYLELALRLNTQLVSADRKLLTAARSCGIPCLDL